MPATRTPRQMSARELDAAMQNYAKSVYENPLMPGNLVYRMLPEQFQEMYRAPLGAALSGISYLTDRGTVKDVPKDINKAGKAIAQNAGSYLDLFNTVYNAISGGPEPSMSGLITGEEPKSDPNYYRVQAGDAYQRMFNPEPADPRLERALDMYADPLVAAGSARRAVNVLTDPMLYRQIADELGGANRAYAIENLYHGSPHTFDRFDSSKIGTGEGAQAYGHGVYLAESPDVAKGYQENVTALRMPKDSLDDVEVSTAKNFKILYKNDPQKLDSMMRSLYGDRAEDVMARADAVSGNLYQTRLAWPDPAREAAAPLKPEDFLDWDKPLSAQPPSVRKAISAMGKDDEWRSMVREAKREGMTAGEFYDLIAGDESGYPFATEILSSYGIPGAKYLDAGSRAAGEGSRNYVVFDDKLIDIVARNNQPIKKAEAPQAKMPAINPNYEKNVMDRLSYLFKKTDKDRYNNIYEKYQAELDNNGTIGGKPYGLDMPGLDRDEYGELTDLGLQQHYDITSDVIDNLAKKESGVISGFDDIDEMSDAPTARDAVVQYLREANIDFVTPRSGGSSYIEVYPKGWENIDNPKTLKLRFADHANESSKYRESDYNWIAKSVMGGEDKSFSTIKEMIDAAHKYSGVPIGKTK